MPLQHIKDGAYMDSLLLLFYESPLFVKVEKPLAPSRGHYPDVIVSLVCSWPHDNNTGIPSCYQWYSTASLLDDTYGAKKGSLAPLMPYQTSHTPAQNLLALGLYPAAGCTTPGPPPSPWDEGPSHAGTLEVCTVTI